MATIDSRRTAFNAWVAEHGPTVADVARRAGVPQTTLYSYASGKSQSLKGITQEKIASAYRVRGPLARSMTPIGVDPVLRKAGWHQQHGRFHAAGVVAVLYTR